MEPKAFEPPAGQAARSGTDPQAASQDGSEPGLKIDGPSDKDLIDQVKAGKREGFDALIRRYQRQAVAVSYRLLGNTHDALEVTQDAFLKAYSSLATLQKPDA